MPERILLALQGQRDPLGLTAGSDHVLSLACQPHSALSNGIAALHERGKGRQGRELIPPRHPVKAGLQAWILGGGEAWPGTNSNGSNVARQNSYSA